jgi:hypothetical protein
MRERCVDDDDAPRQRVLGARAADDACEARPLS